MEDNVNCIYFMPSKVDEVGLLAAYTLAKEYVKTKSICAGCDCAEMLFAALDGAVIKPEDKR